MTRRATRRPRHFAKPAHWGDAPPPTPRETVDESEEGELSPTRYGDWVKKGIAVDF